MRRRSTRRLDRSADERWSESLLATDAVSSSSPDSCLAGSVLGSSVLGSAFGFRLYFVATRLSFCGSASVADCDGGGATLVAAAGEVTGAEKTAEGAAARSTGGDADGGDEGGGATGA